MTGHHPWSALLERTFTPEERAAEIRPQSLANESGHGGRRRRIGVSEARFRPMIGPRPPGESDRSQRRGAL